jgi:hypothetical protein
MNLMNLKIGTYSLVTVILGLLWWPGLIPAQTGSSKPITKNGLTHALEIGGLSQKELVDQVNRRGVDFTVTAQSEAELRRAGAEDSLIEAVRENYRGATNSTTAMAALDSDSGNASSSRPARASSDGGSQRHSATTLHDIRKLYIEKMPDGLDGYLRAAISKKLGGFFTIVLDRSDADAILQSTDARSPGSVSIVDLSGKVVIWSGSADDKEKVYLNFRHGGQREVAEKLAGQLKKALE